MWVYFGALSSSPLICVSVFMSAPCSVVRFGIRVLCLQLCSSFSKMLWLLGGSHGSIQALELLLSISVKNVTRTLIEIALNLYMALGSIINILRILIFLIHEHGIVFHLFVSSQFLSWMSYGFQCTYLSLFGLTLFLSILRSVMLL